MIHTHTHALTRQGAATKAMTMSLNIWYYGLEARGRGNLVAAFPPLTERCVHGIHDVISSRTLLKIRKPLSNLYGLKLKNIRGQPSFTLSDYM